MEEAIRKDQGIEGDLTRHEAREAYLAQHQWRNVPRESLPRDASKRQYHRLYLPDNATQLLMDDPPPQSDVRKFVKVTEILEKLNLVVPKVYHYDDANGFALIEDFGSRTFTHVLSKTKDQEKSLYELALGVIIELGKKSPLLSKADKMALPFYDEAIFCQEARRFVDWYCPHFLKIKLSSLAIEEFEVVWRTLWPFASQMPVTLILRDFHVENLMILGSEMMRCGIIDYQDAAWGPPAYDLVSLLEDERRYLSPQLRASLMEIYLDAFPHCRSTSFLSSFVILGAQRHIKNMGVFARAFVADGKEKYLQFFPIMKKYLQEVVDDPILHPLKEWMTQYGINLFER